MKFIRKMFRLFAENTRGDIYYHECGHLIIAFMFPDVFEVKYVTLDEGTSRMHDATSLGGMRGTVLKPLNSMSVYEHDSMILIMLAGFSADNINDNWGVNNEIYKNVWKSKLVQYKYSGDIELINRHLPFIENSLRGGLDDYLLESIKFMDSVLDSSDVWDTIERLRGVLRASKKPLFTSAEIYDVIGKHRFENWVASRFNNMVKKRHEVIFSY